ncbi:hypothetical protein Efla_000802 [Eimeria flavescens]
MQAAEAWRLREREFWPPNALCWQHLVPAAAEAAVRLEVRYPVKREAKKVLAACYCQPPASRPWASPYAALRCLGRVEGEAESEEGGPAANKRAAAAEVHAAAQTDEAVKAHSCLALSSSSSSCCCCRSSSCCYASSVSGCSRSLSSSSSGSTRVSFSCEMASFSSVLLPLQAQPTSAGVSEHQQQQQEQQQVLRGSAALSLTPQTAKRLLLQHREWQHAAIFTGSGLSVAATFAESADFRALVGAFASREAAISAGVSFLGHTYAVTRYAPPLIVCRRGSLEDTEGLAILKGLSRMGEHLLLVTTYRPPAVSASAVSQMRRFFVSHLGSLPSTDPPEIVQKLRARQQI